MQIAVVVVVDVVLGAAAVIRHVLTVKCNMARQQALLRANVCALDLTRNKKEVSVSVS